MKCYLCSVYKHCAHRIFIAKNEEGFEEALKCFFNRQYELYVIHILSDEEIEPDLSGHLELIDSESFVKTHVSVTESVLNTYKKTLNTYCDTVRKFCVARNIAYSQARTSDSVEDMILRYLKRAGLLK